MQNPDLNKKIISLKLSLNFFNKNNFNEHQNKFINELKNNQAIKKIFTRNDFDTTPILISQIKAILPSLENIYTQFEYFNKLINKENTKLMIFSTMAPFDHTNIIFNQICTVKKIPKITWCHGGYCSLSLHGYDSTDFKSCQNHFSYGSYLKELVINKNFYPKTIYKKKYQCYNIGSPNINLRFNTLNKDQRPKRKIVFVKTGVDHYNQDSFPGKKNTKKFILTFNKKILNILKKYQFDYEIIFKNYAYTFDGNNHYWKNYLAENNMNNIKYISNEISLEKILDDNQLVLLPWLSTTFFQALPFKNQIFLYDAECFDKYLKECKNEINYFKKEENFLFSLKNYLPKLKNVKFKSNKKSIKLFLNGNNSAKIKKNFQSAVNDVVKNNYI